MTTSSLEKQNIQHLWTSCGMPACFFSLSELRGKVLHHSCWRQLNLLRQDGRKSSVLSHCFTQDYDNGNWDYEATYIFCRKGVLKIDFLPWTYKQKLLKAGTESAFSSWRSDLLIVWFYIKSTVSQQLTELFHVASLWIIIKKIETVILFVV